VAGMLQVNSQFLYALIDLGATHSFMANQIVEKLGKCLNKVDKGFTISTPLGETVNIDSVYK
jgi:predicted aspartyl protease